MNTTTITLPTNVTVFLGNIRESFLFYGDVQAAVTKLRDQYTGPNVITLEGKFADQEAVCEELFDLTNNPYRQAEREAQYGRGRSISIGDIIGVDSEDTGITTFYVCAPDGWVVVQ